MKICLLAESATNPVLSSVLDALAERHRVTVADPRELAPALARRSLPRGDLADVYLLKSRSPEAQSVRPTARSAPGAVVVNGPRADGGRPRPLGHGHPARPRRRPRAAHVVLPDAVADGRVTPWSASACPGRWWSRAAPAPAATSSASSATCADLLDLLPEWGDEPVIAQEFVANDGFDIKVLGHRRRPVSGPTAPARWRSSTRAPTWLSTADRPAGRLAGRRAARGCGPGPGPVRRRPAGHRPRTGRHRRQRLPRVPGGPRPGGVHAPLPREPRGREDGARHEPPSTTTPWPSPTGVAAALDDGTARSRGAAPTRGPR